MTIKDLLQKYEENYEAKTFPDVIEHASSLNRELLICDVTEDFASGVEMAIRFWNQQDEGIPVEERKPIKIFIDSGGGSIVACFTIIDSITMSKTPVYTIVIGGAYSAGLEIAVSGHKRFCYQNSSYLFHEGSIAGNIALDANKFKNLADFYKQQILRSKKLLFKHTKIDEEWYKEHQNDDVWIFAEEAVELGFVDEIVTEFVK